MNNPIFMNYVLPAILVIGFAIYMFRPKKSKIERNMGEVTYHYLAPKDAESKLNEPDIILIDVRNEEYYAKSHLKDSINFPYVDIHHAARRRLYNKNLDYQRLSASAIMLAIVIIALIALLFAIENYFGKDVEG